MLLRLTTLLSSILLHRKHTSAHAAWQATGAGFLGRNMQVAVVKEDSIRQPFDMCSGNTERMTFCLLVILCCFLLCAFFSSLMTWSNTASRATLMKLQPVQLHLALLRVHCMTFLPQAQVAAARFPP